MNIIFRVLKDKIRPFIPLIVITIFMLVYGNLLAPFFISVIIAYLLNPLLIILEKKISRIGALFLIFFVLVICISWLVLSFMPSVITEVGNLIKNLPVYIDKLSQYKKIEFPYKREIIERVSTELMSMGNQFLNRGYSFIVIGINIAVNIITIPIFTFYFLKDKEKISKFFSNFIPLKYENVFFPFLKKLDLRLKGFIKGQFLDFTILTAVLSSGFMILGIDFAIILGVCGAVFNLVPYLGMILSGTLILTMSFLQAHDPVMVLKAGIFFGLAQMFDSLIVAPNVVGNAANVHPLAIIIALMVGGATFGIPGLIVAIPMVIFIDVFLEHFKLLKK